MIKYVYAVYYRNRYDSKDNRLEFKTLTEGKRWSKRLAKSYKYVTLQKESKNIVSILEFWYQGEKA